MSTAQAEQTVRFRSWGSLALGVCAGLALSTCFKSPAFDGPYRCFEDGGCGNTGMTCDDGLCCRPGGEPWCPSYVADGGTCADGGAPPKYYLDEDTDGFGRDDVWRLYCSPPVVAPYVLRGGDCNDTPGIGMTFNPDAPEVCDGVDNNCNGVLDDGVTPQQEFFFDDDGDDAGNADAGVWACAAPPGYVPNGLDCNPGDPRVGAPSYDKCDGLDNNCNGSTDERPGCGGPPLLSAGVNLGVARLAAFYNVDPPNCLDDAPVNTGVADTLAMPGMVWTGEGYETHLFWAEAPAGPNAYWDLSDAGTFALRLSMTCNCNWAPMNPQPVVILCGPAGHVCYFHRATSTDPQPSPINIFPVNGQNVTDAYSNVYLRGGNGWEVGCGGADGGTLDAVLRQVRRVEILAEPYKLGSTFTIDLNEGTLGFQ